MPFFAYLAAQLGIIFKYNILAASFLELPSKGKVLWKLEEIKAQTPAGFELTIF